MNKYERWYKELIITRKNISRNLVYKERHHIIPKSMGGKDTEENIVELTPREHFIAHALLYKAYPCKQTACALHFMLIDNQSCKRYRPKSSKLYEFAKNEKYNFIRGKSIPKTKTCEYCNAYVTNSSFKSYHGEKCVYHPILEIAAKNKEQRKRPNKLGKSWSVGDLTCPWCNKTGKSGNMLQWHFDRCKLNPNIDLSKELSRRKTVTESSRNAASNNAYTRSQLQLICPWCDKTGRGSAMKTWHFDNCKYNPNGAKKRPTKNPLSDDHKAKIKAGLSNSSKKLGAPRKH